jgi:hypothetical protein
MAFGRLLSICTLLAVLAGCRAEVPRQSLKDHAAPPPSASVAAPTPAPVASTDKDQPKDQLHAWCWNRYREHLAGERPRSFEEKLSADSACRLIVCPTCPR